MALASLTFYGCADEDKGQSPITINTTMTEAKFNDKNLNVTGVMIIAAFIESKQVALTSLDLSNNPKIGASSASDIGVNALAAALTQNTTITNVNLASNRLDANSATILARAIPHMSNLRVLDTSKNNAIIW